MFMINKSTLRIFESLKEMQQFSHTFRQKLETLSKYDTFSNEYLQNVI